MKHLTKLLILFLFSSCTCQQNSECTFVKEASPGSVKMNPHLIKKLVSDIKSGKIKNVHGLIIIKDDKLITEEYFAGYHRERLHYTASVSKSFASALFGIAVDNGFFGNDMNSLMDKTASEVFHDYKEIIKSESGKDSLRMKHILSMTAGLKWDEHTFPYSDNRNDCNRINNSPDPMKFLFEKEQEHTPGSVFYYNGGLSLSISYLIEEYTKLPVDKFAEKYLFRPLDINDYEWESTSNGLIDTDGGLHLKPIDQAKLGYLYLKKGTWNENKIISKEWVDISTTMHKRNVGLPDYGFQWWGGDYTYSTDSFSMYLASGHGGQKIVIIPSLNTVIVLTQQVFDNPFADLNFIAILSDYILPSIKSSSQAKLNSEDSLGLDKYVGHYVLSDESEYVDFSIKEKTLLGESSTGEFNTFTPVAKNVFRTRISDLINIDITFTENSAGEISGFTTAFAFSIKNYLKQD